MIKEPHKLIKPIIPRNFQNKITYIPQTQCHTTIKDKENTEPKVFIYQIYENRK